MTKDELCRLEQPKFVKLIDEGKLVNVPCALGSKVYTVYRNKPKEWEVVHIGLCGDGGVSIHLLWYKNKYNFKSICCSKEDIGKTVFLTREEAEQKLKEG